MGSYQEFLRAKVQFDRSCGFQVQDSEIHPLLKPHQRDIVRWAVAKGRAAIFAAFGLGKTFMQLEAVRLLIEHKGGEALIVAPLGVRQEFKRDAEKLGQSIRFIRTNDEVDGPGLYLTNYESIRDGKIDPRKLHSGEPR
jgi:superfamily II DNA or RNA helicase